MPTAGLISYQILVCILQINIQYSESNVIYLITLAYTDQAAGGIMAEEAELFSQ